MRRLPLALLAIALASCAGPGRAPEGRDPARPPPDARPGAFSWREVRGGKDRIDALRALRDNVLALFEEAARFPGASGAPSPAAREVPAIRAAFDDQAAPEELEARIVYFDGRRQAARGEEVRSEGIEVLLRRRAAAPAGTTQELVLALEDVAIARTVDGRIDQIGFRWSDGGGPAVRAALAIWPEGQQLAEYVTLAGEPQYRVTSPGLDAILERAQLDIYRPLTLDLRRGVRDGTAPLLPRPAAPAGTSFVAEAPPGGR